MAQEAQAHPIRVLIVDDSKDSAKTLGWMVEYAGHETRLAHDGASAIEIAKTYEPNVILLDIGLPGMNGYEVCKAMHEDRIAQKAVFIAQTGWGQPEHRQRSKEAGFDHHLVKPIDMQVLKHLLNGIAQSQ
jgi:CheY-like chemotaxis protein